MKKTIKRTFASIAITAFVAMTGTITLLLNPEPLFAHQTIYRNFKINSDFKIENEIHPILDEAIELVSSSKIYDPKYKYDLFFGHENVFNKIDDKLMGIGPMARANGNNILIKSRTDILKNKMIGSGSEVNLSESIAHEMVHCLQQHHFGKSKFNPFYRPPNWKVEGHCEYFSKRKLLSSPERAFL